MQEKTARPDGEVGEVGELVPPFYPAEPLSTTLDRIVEFNKRFVHHRHDTTHDLIALWIAHTYAMPVWDWTGRLYVTAPQEGCGKSTQAEVMALLCPDSLPTASISGPGLFRSIGEGSPTLFIDEAENQFSVHGGRDREIVTAVMNAGYKQGAFVVRSESNRPVKHSVYAAACIIGIDNGLLPDTTRSRCIPVRMTPGPSVQEKMRPRRHAEFATEVGSRLADKAMDWGLIESPLSMRQGDIWEALFSVAHAAGPEWVARAEKALADHQWTDSATESARILEGVRRYFEQTKADRVTSAVLAQHLSNDDELPTISPKALAKVMKGYEVTATKSNGLMTYHREALEPAFKVWIRGDGA
jgi:hypothetical protein